MRQRLHTFTGHAHCMSLLHRQPAPARQAQCRCCSLCVWQCSMSSWQRLTVAAVWPDLHRGAARGRPANGIETFQAPTACLPCQRHPSRAAQRRWPFVAAPRRCLLSGLLQRRRLVQRWSPARSPGCPPQTSLHTQHAAPAGRGKASPAAGAALPAAAAGLPAPPTSTCEHESPSVSACPADRLPPAWVQQVRQHA